VDKTKTKNHPPNHHSCYKPWENGWFMAYVLPRSKARPKVANMPLLSNAMALGSPASALSWRPAGLVTWSEEDVAGINP
jgi:hypothetical protein